MNKEEFLAFALSRITELAEETNQLTTIASNNLESGKGLSFHGCMIGLRSNIAEMEELSKSIKSITDTMPWL